MSLNFDVYKLPSPCYVVDESLLIKNLKILRHIADAGGCKILLAQKAFSMFSFYPLIAEYLDGTAASGLHEALLSDEYMGKENHVFSAAYSDEEFAAVLPICSHIIFNSFSQWDRFKNQALKSGKNFGIRVNPEFSTQGDFAKDGIYDPCAPGSRLGVTSANFRFNALNGTGLNGIHFHTLCQQNADALEATLAETEKKFSACFNQVSWVNFGGGHHITREDYDTEKLISIIKNFKQKYGTEVYLEPGEAIALNAGFLISTVLDIIDNNDNIAILDASAACHMPDVLEMPYRPVIIGAGEADEKPNTYTLAGSTCLSGDYIGKYSFDTPLKTGDRLVFEDMAIYTMVKNNTFNGINLPAIVKCRTNGETQVVRHFNYSDFKSRLS